MFQLGFGLSPVDSGLLLLIYMAANLLMKTVTNAILRRFGLKNVLVVNSLIASACIAACALISVGAPLVVTGLILTAAGASRSMQFTAITMVTFADVTAEHRAPAAVVSSLSQQVTMGMGVAVGALMLNLSQAIRRGVELTTFDFRIALVMAGALSALAVISYASLDKNAGAEISGHGAKPA
jgi:MFS family permease